MASATFDYIIVGGGSAGSVLANRDPVVRGPLTIRDPAANHARSRSVSDAAALPRARGEVAAREHLADV